MNDLDKYQILAAVTDAIIITDSEFRIQEWSAAAEVIYGWRGAEVIGKRLSEVIPVQEYLDSTPENALNGVKNAGHWEGEVVHPKRDGQRVYILASVTIFYDEQGQPKGYIGINRDVSQRHKIQKDLKEMNARMLTLRELDKAILAAQSTSEIAHVALMHLARLIPVDGGWASILQFDKETNKVETLAREGDYAAGFVKSNLKIEDLGLTPTLYEGRAEWNLAVDELPVSHIRTVLQTMGIQSFIRVPIMVNGALVATLNVPSRIPNVFTELHAEIAREVADLIAIAIRQQRIERLEKALERERELNELKTRFVQMISHEFRTPLTTILASAEIVRNYGERISRERQGYHIEKIQQGVNHLNNLIEDILTLSRGETQGLEFKPRILDLVKFCDEYTEEMQVLAGTSHLIVYEPQVAQCVGLFDDNLLRIILNNLMGNALKYSEEGKPVYLRLWHEQAHVTLEVHDHGFGIPLDEQENIFQNFFRGTNVGTLPGTGLGLPIAQLATQAHHGHIRFDSAPAQGSRFCVDLPFNPTPPQP